MEFTTTVLWMFGIMGMMVLFGVCAAILSRLGKKNRENDEDSNKTDR
ncbi:MAG: hypothetical protein LIO58_06325 [Oscillospiraceae bacterium]|nr:hypothetical protein [Oscillospiraceae bacterium]